MARRRAIALALVLACSERKKAPPPPPVELEIPIPPGERIAPDAAQPYCTTCESTCRDGDDSACRGYRQWVNDQSYPKPKDALEIATSGCKRGSPAACELIADLDAEKSVQYTERACNLGGDHACWVYANWLSDGRYVAQDEARAAILWQQACEHSFMPACGTLALHLATAGKFTDAAKWYERGCNGHEPGACYALGLIYDEGLGVTPDRKRALDLLAKECNGFNDHEACEVYREIVTRKEPPEVITVRTFVIRAPGPRTIEDARRAADKAVRSLGEGTDIHVVATVAGGEDVSEKPETRYRHTTKDADEDKVFALKPGTARADLSYMGFFVVYRER